MSMAQRGEHIKIGNRIFGKFNSEPAVALIIDEYLDIEKIVEYKNRGVALFEIRFDLLDEPFEKAFEYAKKIKEKTDLPLIGTIRKTEYNSGLRVGFFEKILTVVDAVDIEIEAEIAKDVADLSDRLGKVLIVSEHDFKKMPDKNGLDRIVSDSLEIGADVVKIAATSKSLKETASLLDYTYNADIPMVSIAMGDFGKISRMGAMFFGSLYTYTFVSKSVAPGQINLDEIISDINKYYPSSRLR